jgi:hypothetical protein
LPPSILNKMTSQESVVARDSMGFEDIDEFWDTVGTLRAVDLRFSCCMDTERRLGMIKD